MKSYSSASEQQTEQFAEQFAKLLHKGDIIAFRGGMGMGKTAFTRGLARGLGADAREVSSPTFALVHEYYGDNVTLYHFDMYRVDGYDDLYSTGFFDYLDSGGILAIEWSEKIVEDLPPNTITVEISAVPDDPDKRVIAIKGDDRF